MIAFNESAISFRQKLESLPTIYTVKVTRAALSSQYQLYSWTVTFTHTRREVVQGAGNLPPMTVATSTLQPSESASVLVFEAIKGTHALAVNIKNLSPGVTYNARVTAYNDRGYSTHSHFSSAMPIGQPPQLQEVDIGISSPTSLNVSWVVPSGFDYFVDGFLVESYTSVPVYEEQVITSSSANSLVEIQRLTIDADANNIGGYFKLSFGGLQTRNIRWNANAMGEGSIALELTRLSTVGPVAVTREMSRRVVQGLRVNITQGATVASVSAGSTAALSLADTIWISGEQFTIAAVSATSITLSSPLVTSTLSFVAVYKWSYGYDWDITFLSKIGEIPLLTTQSSDNWAGTNPVLKMSPVREGVNPLSGTFRVGYGGVMTPPLNSNVSSSEMKTAIEALGTVSQVDVARYSNGFGFDWRVTFTSELGNINSMVINDAGLAGPFASAAVTTAVQGILPSNYSSLFLSGGFTRSAVIRNLRQGLPYQIRVRSHNSVGYSYPLISTPAFLSPKAPPSVPYNISIFALSSTRIRVNWFYPLDDGGAPIQQYLVQWDVSSGFTNAVANGNSRSVQVNPGDGPVYCITFDIAVSSSNIARFARVAANNGYTWSAFGYPTPVSATGQVRSPGAPSAVSALPTDAVGIYVTWQPPDASTCFFGGDGGSTVSYYVVEWDNREDFSTPASQAFVYALSSLVYLIGGRDILTGKERADLTPGGSYYVRVTAFNAVGAGVAAYAAGPIVLADQTPLAPRDINMFPLSATQLYASWNYPLRDGGETLEKYRLEYSTNTSFAYYTAVDLPLVHEVQTVAIDSPVAIETQAITLLAHVTNERQIVRSTLTPAIDEIQTVTLFCDDVTNEIQRIMTTANDIDEEQTIEFTGTEVHEIQLVQSHVSGLPEIQTVDVSSPRVNEVQTLGVIVSGIDTSACSTGTSCASVESSFDGYFRVQFDPNQCGTDSDKVASNWCVIALNDAGVTGYDCSSTSCLSGYISLTDTASSVQTSLCSIHGSGSTSFMTSSDGLCVAVNRTSYAINSNATAGSYLIMYSIEFNGQYVRGNVPALTVLSSNVTYSAGTATYLTSYTNTTSGITSRLGSVDTASNIAYTLKEGNQPNGLFTLTYSCEARTVFTVVNVTAVPGGATSIITVPNSILVQYEYIRIQTTYHQIILANANGTVGTISPAFDLAPYSGITTFANAETGAFYSDPYDTFGVSAACYIPSPHITIGMNQSVAAADVSAKLRDLSPVVVDTDDSLTITRTYYPANSSRVGYIWTIQFNRQNGDLIPLICGASNLAGTSTIGGASCTVSTVQEGTLISGSFSLGIISPNAYISTPVNYSSISVPWNIDAISLTSILSSTTGFGVVVVTREPYFAQQTRWSGGYLWTVSFSARTGDVPPLVPVSNLTTATVATTLNVGGHDTPLLYDDPGTAVEGNQVGGYFGFTFTDTNGTQYASNVSAYSVVSNVTGQAVSAAEFKAYLVNFFRGQDIVEVGRSASPNAVMGYTYTVKFTGQAVGGDVQNLNPLTSLLTHTTTASNAHQVGTICTDATQCTVGSFVVNVGINVVESVTGAQLQGSFQLRFNGASTGALPYNAEAVQVQSALNNLATVAPSAVKVSRFGPMRTPATQVFGYVWEITFNSNTWVDPRVDHSVYIDGNWQGSATTWDSVWDSGYSKSWGRQVGDQPLIDCSAAGLFATDGVLPTNACTVEEVVKGTAPLKGTFTLTLDTLNPPHPVINIQGVLTTGPIAFNAFANATESGGDGSSVEERLTALENVGDVSVSRSDVDRKTGGFTWFITFLRDADKPGGQWGGQCEQKDSFFGLCNSPGNVPSLQFSILTLSATCLSSTSAATYTCPLGLVMTGDSVATSEPGGSREVQRLYLSNPLYDTSFTAGLRSFTLSYNGTITSNITVNSTAAQVQAVLQTSIPSLAINSSLNQRGIIVTEALDPVNAPNGKVFTFYFIDEGDKPKMIVNPTLPDGYSVDPIYWTATLNTVSDGAVYGLTASKAGVVNGILQRGRFTSFFVNGEGYSNSSLLWNALPEGTNAFSNNSIKSQIEKVSGHKVNVTRLVIGKYGVVQYEIRFVYNPGFFPPGAGNIPLLNVTQAVATDGVEYPPQVYELVRGSDGISGTFDIDLHNDVGRRTVYFNESADRFGRKLEEMSSVGVVYVERSEYPSAVSGGWGENLVDDGTLGGYQWKVFFKKNPGVSDGYSFPPGSGNIDPISVYSDTSTLFGTQVAVTVSTLQDGSTPLDGTFTLTFNGSTTEPISFDQQPLETKYLLEGLDTIGHVSVASIPRVMQQIPGIFASISRDGAVLSIEYDNSSIAQAPADIREALTPGDLIRVGGGVDTFDGASFYSLVGVSPDSPVVSVLDTSAPQVLPGEQIRVGFDAYSVLRSGVEVQALSLTCASLTARCGDLVLSFLHNGVRASLAPVLRLTSGNMTSASDLQWSFSTLSTVTTGDVTVTRQNSFDGLSFVYKFYFEGASVLGNVNALTANGTCTGCTYSLVTLVEGGFTESQQLRVNVDEGYLTGGLLALTASSGATGVNATTSCLNYGAEASEVEAALQGLSVLNNKLLPFTATIVTTNLFLASSSIFGLLHIGDNVTIGSNTSLVYSVSSVLNGTYVSVLPAMSQTIGSTGLRVGAVVSSAVQVARQGTGNSTAELVTLTSTADSFIVSGSGGFYKLKFIISGDERLTSCLDFHASASDIQAAIDNLGYDFSGDGFITTADQGHITVSREGDGTATSGYGYVYSLRFAGPMLAFGRSNIMGASLPSIEVVDEGHYGSCYDLTGNVTSSILIDVTLSSGSYNWTTFGGVTTEGTLQPGDRIRVPDSYSPNTTFTVLITNIDSGSTLFTVDGKFYTNATSFVTAYVYSSGTPSFTVQRRQAGEDAYSYTIYMSGPHLTDVPLVAPVICSQFIHVDGMRYGVQVNALQQGGSSEVEGIYMTSTVSAITNSSGAYWKLVFNGVGAVTVLPSLQSGGFVWGISASDLQTSIATLGLNITVARTGTGSAEENYAYNYALTYPESLDQQNYLQVLLNRQVSSPLFISGNSTEPAYYLNDLTTSGYYSGPSDLVFYIQIASLALPAVNTTSDMFIWRSTVNATFSSAINITEGVATPLVYGISIAFASSTGHAVGDAWQFVAVVTNNSLPAGASISYAGVSSGAPKVNQLTLSTGYAGQATTSLAAYKPAPVYTVASQSVLSFELLTQNGTVFAFHSDYAGAALINTTSTCVNWDDLDWVVEKALNAMYAGICSADVTADCITVTRGVDAINNYGGYQYFIYFEHPAFAVNFANQLTVVASSCSGFVAGKASITQSSAGNQHYSLTKQQLPLGLLSVASQLATFKGLSVTRVPLYKVSGNDWGVTFDTNIGDLPALIATPSDYLAQGASLYTYDNVIQGVHPLSYIINNALTGINYGARVRAYTRGPLHGYSAYSSPITISAPATVPDAVESFSVGPVLNTYEVQELIVGASHGREIQEIRSTAAQYAEEQLLTLTVPVGGPALNGGFALRFPSVQTIQIRASTTLPAAGTYQLRYYYYDFDTHGSALVNQTTSCIGLDVDPSVVMNALQSLTVIDSVTVEKSGYGGYTSFFGYTYTVAFVGNMVAGQVQLMEVVVGGVGCSSSNSLSGVNFYVNDISAHPAVGTDTEIQMLTLQSQRSISQGEYRVAFEYPSGNIQTSACLAWNATAEDLTLALDALTNIDSVFVDRVGAGDASSAFGYSYTVYFVGAAMHKQNRTSTLGVLQAMYTPGTCTGFDFAAFASNGVLQYISNSSFGFNTTVVQQRGFNVDAGALDAAALDTALTLLPSYVMINSTSRSLTEDGYGFIYTIIFSTAMGDVPTLACGTGDYLTSIGGVCTPATIIDGNFLRGYFIVGTSNLIAADASALDMQTELNKLSGIGYVSVSRSGPDSQGGYSWLVTFLTSNVNIDAFKISNLLTGSNAAVVATVVQPLNQLGGSYTLQYNGYISTAIPYNASTTLLTSILQASSMNIGSVSVSFEQSTTEAGSIYLITFTGSAGNKPLLVPDYSNLSGNNAIVQVFESVRGNVAEGDALALSIGSPLYCSHSQVLEGHCGSPILGYSVDVYTSVGVKVQTVVINATYNIQIVRTAALSLLDQVYLRNQLVTGYFQLTFNADVSRPINAQASATDVRDLLEALPSINAVQVSRDYSAEKMSSTLVTVPGQLYVTCTTAACDFASLPAGELVWVGGSWYRVDDSFRGSATVLPLALAADSSIPTYYSGFASTAMPLYRWARGYEWAVTFLSTATSPIVQLGSLQHGLNPADATVAIRSTPCGSCALISGLSSFTNYLLTIRPFNQYGYGAPYSIIGAPKEIPGAPTSITLTGNTGTSLLLTFSIPAVANQQITGYTVEWDTTPLFTNASLSSASCTTAGYGNCLLTGSAIQSNPIEYIIQNLQLGVTYYARVAARNDISNAGNSTTAADNTNWSETVYYTTSNQRPDAPVQVLIAQNGPTHIQVIVTPPANNGGLAIASYKFEWDVVSSFDSALYGSTNVPSDPVNLPRIAKNNTGNIVYELTALVSGQSYFVRVAAANSIGYGLTALSTTTATPAAKPNAPASVSLSYDTTLPLITSIGVSWTAPTGLLADGGAAISGYLVEWWQPGAVFDQQLIRWTSSFFKTIQNGTFFLSFGPSPGIKHTTTVLNYDISEWNLRSELMNLNFSTDPVLRSILSVPVGNVEVSRSAILSQGYQWAVTFESILNQGNQVLLTGSPLVTGAGETVVVEKLVAGRRDGGHHEVQLVTIYSEASTSPADLGGWFRLSFNAFNGTLTQTQYIQVNATAAVVQRELAQLSTLRAVTVTKSIVTSSTFAGYQWQVTFSGDVGDQPKLGIDSTLIFTSQINTRAFIDDGDNSLGLDGTKASNAEIGEPPKGYTSTIVGADVRSFNISSLVPGLQYFVAVSAINSLGAGVSSVPSSVSATPPLAAPQPPTNVTIAVHTGSTTQLDVTYSAPSTDGGAPVLYYRVELDTTAQFYNPIVSIIPCPTSNLHTVFQIKTSGNSTNPITAGYFQLVLSVNGASYTTDYIPYDAAAMLADEEGLITVVGGVTTSLLNGAMNFSANVDVSNLIFVNDRLVFSTQSYSADIFIVRNVTGAVVTVDHAIVANTTATSTISRYVGGRGVNTASPIACVPSAAYAFCTASRRQVSGSLQSKLQEIADVFVKGVHVERDAPDSHNGYTWRVTFLDDSPSSALDFSLAVVSSSLTGSTGTVTATQQLAGTVYGTCTGRHTVPQNAFLVLGQYYFARVFAVNKVGFSLAQISSSSQKPMVVPGAPTSVTLSVLSNTELRVVFNPPVDDGGDAITSYLVEYATRPDFSNLQSVLVTYLAGGAPYFKTISGLTPGVFVFVRVRAGNSQGYGAAQPSTPASLNPYQSSSAPINTELRVSSQTMLTVSFDLPFDNGGDTVTKFRVEWDTVPGFNGISPFPNKGYADLDAQAYRSYTIQYLTAGQRYYVRVFAINSAGPGTAALTTPAFAVTSAQVPGKPHTIVATSGSVSGSIALSWLRPRVPWHGIPCSGLTTAPNDCPPVIGGGLPASDGGLPITEYAIGYNDLPDFSGLDNNNGTGFTTTSTAYTLTGLTPSKLYYIRVLARNSQGAGPYCNFVERNCLIVSTRAQAIALA